VHVLHGFSDCPAGSALLREGGRCRLPPWSSARSILRSLGVSSKIVTLDGGYCTKFWYFLSLSLLPLLLLCKSVMYVNSETCSAICFEHCWEEYVAISYWINSGPFNLRVVSSESMLRGTVLIKWYVHMQLLCNVTFYIHWRIGCKFPLQGLYMDLIKWGAPPRISLGWPPKCTQPCGMYSLLTLTETVIAWFSGIRYCNLECLNLRKTYSSLFHLRMLKIIDVIRHTETFCF
jgi:hypothetical protein